MSKGIEDVIENCRACNKAVEQRLNKLEREVDGNGQPGLRAVVVRLEERVEALSRKVDDLSSKLSSLSTLLYTGLGAIGALQLVLRFLVK